VECESFSAANHRFRSSFMDIIKGSRTTLPRRPDSFHARLLTWRARNVSQTQLVHVAAVVLGLLAGMSAVLLKNGVHVVQEIVHADPLGLSFDLYFFLFPVLGVGLTALLMAGTGGNPGEAIPITLHAISKRRGFIPKRYLYAWYISSFITAGFGGSVGLEGPGVGTGAAIGSNAGRMFRLDFRNRILLLGCASAGVLAAIFNAPIAGIIFTIEIFSLDLTLASLVPLLLASVAGALTSHFMHANEFILHVTSVEPFRVADVPWYVILGVLSALVSVYFTRSFFFFESLFRRLRSGVGKWAAGGLGLGLMVWLLPPLYGEGFQTVNLLLNDQAGSVLSGGLPALLAGRGGAFLIGGLLVLLFTKIVASGLTFGAGGVGGVFAPSLFTGCVLGFVYATAVGLLDMAQLDTTNFALVGMAGLMAGVLHAPLTAIFMIAEITGGYELFLPLMIVSAISFATSRHLLPFSIYTKKLAQRGELITHDKDKAVLSQLTIRDIVERDFSPVHADMTMGTLVNVVSTSNRNLFPVLGKDGCLIGVLTLDDIRHVMFDRALYNLILVGELMDPPPASVDVSENMSTVVQRFQETGLWNIPVVEDGRYIGFVSKSKLFSIYRSKLLEFS